MSPEIKLQLIMAGVWLFMVYKTLPQYILSIKSKTWPICKATVITSSFDRNGNAYSPKIIYHYSLDGKEYKNDSYTYLGALFFSKNQSIKVSNNHPIGSEVEIHYDPNKPENSVIVPGVHWGQNLSIVLISLFFLGVAFIVPILNFIWPGCQPNCK